VSLWDRVYPMVLGIPFNLFWLILWLLLTPLCMWGAYRVEVSTSATGTSDNHGEEGGPR
jgi:membrane protein required for beta-lactamase induction